MSTAAFYPAGQPTGLMTCRACHGAGVVHREPGLSYTRSARTRWLPDAVAWMGAERGDHAGAEAEYRDVLAAKVRVLGPDHPYTKVTESWLPTPKP